MSDSARKYVYRFGDGKADGDKSLKQLLGGKGANLGEMSSIGLPVPPGFTISTEACLHYLKNEGEWPEGLEEEVEEGLDFTEDVMDLDFGDPEDPLLVSVRSGAAVSMPGMMDTVLNLGLNDEVVDGFAEKMGNERIAYDSYRRLIDMYGNVVMGVDRQHFEEALEEYKQEVGAEHDTDLSADDLKELVETYKEIYARHTGDPFPQDPEDQLRLAINAVFDSWDTPRARKYRKINKITGLLGTAVNVQTMVFGNMGEDSGTGVCFTRNPSTGENELYGEFLVNAQGEDVVAGIRTPQDIQELGDRFPKVYEQLQEVTEKLEDHYKDMEDIEFTVQDKRLFILQTRDGKRTGPAALKIAVDMVDEGLISKKRAVRDMVEPDHLEQLLHPHFEEPESYQDNVLGEGIPASPGAAVGRVVFSADDAEEARERGEQVLLVRTETSPEDVGGMDAAEGILTSRGGMTSHAAVVARGWGKPCVAGCSDISIDYEKAQFTAGDEVVQEGDWISINGTTGEVILGKQPMVEPELGGTFQRYMEWVDQFRTMGVRTNADTGEDAESALQMGAEGIGLCRTEHMFFGEERIKAMRKMILSEDRDARRSALDELVPYQKSDFREIFEAMEGHPVTVRLLDPPLHEFLPGDEKGQQEMAEELGVSAEEVAEKVENLHEMNPMLGHRGCRLGIMYPEITEMQARAILEAASELAAEGVEVEPEIMVPLIGTLEEFQNQKNLIDHTAQLVFDETGQKIDYKVGTMIEVPRAALTAERIAEEADFFSFGTNDLTQMTFGYSRDDAGKWLPQYLDKKILKDEPFEVLDQEGVGQLVARATEDGRSGNPGLKVGICGEHGGEPSSVAFCYDVGLDYVSCSPFRVPIARLAAARAELEEEQEEESAVGEEVAA